MIPKELRLELALKKFLDANIWLQIELSGLNYSLAKDCGLSAEEYKLKYLKEAFETEADACECDVWDFTLQWTTETSEELEFMREERMREIYSFLDS